MAKDWRFESAPAHQLLLDVMSLFPPFCVAPRVMPRGGRPGRFAKNFQKALDILILMCYNKITVKKGE